MLGSPSLQSALWIFDIFAEVLTAVRLYSIGLHKVYRYFFIYLIFQVFRSLVLAPFDPNSDKYAWIYLFLEPFVWLSYVLVVLEVYSLVSRNYRGIYTVGRWALYASMSVSALISIAVLIPSWLRLYQPSPMQFFLPMVERGLAFSLVLFLFFILLLLSWYPIPLSRNLLIHCTVYAVFFLGDAAMIMIRNLVSWESYDTVNTIFLALWGCCYAAWILLLTRAGENRMIVVRHDIRAADEERLITQLNAINSTLLRTARRGA